MADRATKRRSDGAAKRRRGFTMIEMMIAGVITAMILGAISTTLGQLSRARATCKERLEAHLRADVALNHVRRDVASIIRSHDLFYTRFLLRDDTIHTPAGELDSDEMLVFNTRLRPIRNIDFNGEGVEFEAQYRLEEEVLWQRRDAFPDEYPEAGGKATPLVGGVVSLNIEAFDGEQWWDEWDSDHDGLPHAVRITVMASGARPDQDTYEAVLATMRTAVAIDRVVPPADNFKLTEEALAELDGRILVPPSAAGGGTAGEGGAAGGLGVSAPAGGAGGPSGPTGSSSGGTGGRGAARGNSSQGSGTATGGQVPGQMSNSGGGRGSRP